MWKLFALTFVGRCSTRQTCDSGITPADDMNTTNAKHKIGSHEMFDKSCPFEFMYKYTDKPVRPIAHPSKERIRNVFRPILSAACVVHKFPIINITASTMDDLYGSIVVPVLSTMYTA